MKILLVTQVPAYFEQFRLNGQEFPDIQPQSHWLTTLRKMGHKVMVFRYSDPILFPYTSNIVAKWAYLYSPRIYGKYRNLRNRHYWRFPDTKIRSRKLIRIIKEFEPHLLIMTGGISELDGTELKVVKRKKIKLVLMHGVRPTIGATRYEKDNVKFFDLVVSNDPTNKKLWKDLGAKRAVGLPYTAINPKAHKKLMLTRVEKSKYGSKVVFVGTLLPKRQKTLKYLVKNRLPIKIWGHIPPGDKLDKVLEKQYLGEAWGDEETKIYNASLMAVNLVDESMPIGGNLRTFRIPGCGAMQLAQRCSDKWFRKDKEVVLFDNDKQLAEKIEHLLKSPKKIKQIANAGYKRAHKEHIYEKRFEKIMSLVFKNA